MKSFICRNIFREPCCGTHVHNTGDIEDFCIINSKSLGRSTTAIHAVTGSNASMARKNGQQLVEDIEKLHKHIKDNIDKVSSIFISSILLNPLASLANICVQLSWSISPEHEYIQAVLCILGVLIFLAINFQFQLIIQSIVKMFSLTPCFKLAG